MQLHLPSPALRSSVGAPTMCLILGIGHRAHKDCAILRLFNCIDSSVVDHGQNTFFHNALNNYFLGNSNLVEHDVAKQTPANEQQETKAT
ncbi:unnamed protein product [Prunus armeniaca]|uniref:Uncharacterized protein n=1 Tax=Prunus armeniaca TaxID=36596 RepID=A0A6J5VPV0_PRUAR|nr:unnamed protein product [Prunus armeniaca]